MIIKGKKKFIAVCAMLLILCMPITVLADIGLELTNNFFINDYADVISKEAADEIADMGQYLYDRTGAELVLVTVEGLNGYGIEDFAYTLFNEWRLGSAEDNNGMLIIFAPNELLEDGLKGDYAYEIGEGIEDYITAGDMQQLCNEYLESYFLDEDYSGGALSIYEAVGSKLESYLPVLDTYTESQQNNSSQDNQGTYAQDPVQTSNTRSRVTFGDIIGMLLGIVLVVFLIVLVIITPRRRRRYTTIYGVPFNPYSRRYVRRYGHGGYWGPHGRPMNPPPPPPRRSWFGGPRAGRPGPGAPPPGPRGGGAMGTGGTRNSANTGTFGSRPTAGGGGITRGTGGSRSGSGATASKPSSTKSVFGSGSTSAGSRPTSGGGGISRGTGGSRSSSGSRVSAPSSSRSTTSSRVSRPAGGGTSRSGGGSRPSGGGMSRGGSGSRSTGGRRK